MEGIQAERVRTPAETAQAPGMGTSPSDRTFFLYPLATKLESQRRGNHFTRSPCPNVPSQKPPDTEHEVPRPPASPSILLIVSQVLATHLTLPQENKE